MLRSVAAVFLLCTGMAGCSATLVAATVGAVGTASVATYECDAHVVVTIRDRQGNLHCGAVIEATRQGTRRRFESCAWVSLGPGSWQLRELDAPPQSGEALVIEPADGCDHDVYTVELDRERGARARSDRVARYQMPARSRRME